jgi:23S rRNA (uracil1939-C5)-methyltransferase
VSVNQVAPFPAVVDSLSHDGRGVARVEGKVWFVEGALPGETVIVRPTKIRRSFSVGLVDKIIVQSKNRTKAPCQYFGTCGGCALQHLEHSAQLTFKRQTLLDALGKAGVGPVVVTNPIGAMPWGYRRKARLSVRFVPKKGGILVGFRERNNKYVIPLAECLVIDPSVNSVLATLPSLLHGMSAPDRFPQIEVAVGDNATALVFQHLEPLTAGDTYRLEQFARENNLLVYSQSGGSGSVEAIFPGQPVLLDYALPEFSISVGFSPTDFIQVNRLVNQALVGMVVNWLDIRPTDSVLDLFCGLGNFSLPAARGAKRVLGVDQSPSLISRARDNAHRNGISNTAFECRDLCSKDLGKWDPGPFSKVIVDPPRSGALEVLNFVNERVKPRFLAYVSCDPATLARDAASLTKSGAYRLVKLGLADMFPHTAHIESVALFHRCEDTVPGTK